MTTLTWTRGLSAYPEVPFKRLFRPLDRRVPVDAEIVTAYTDGTVTLRRNRRIAGYHEATDLSTFQGVEPGDFVVHGLDILRGSVGVSDSRGAMSPVAVVCEPLVELDPRFFAYAMRAQAATGFPRAMARGIREGGADFRRWDTLGRLPLPVPAVSEQRRIADMLDAETARIDTLIEKKKLAIRLLQQRRSEFEAMSVAEGVDKNPSTGDVHLGWVRRIKRGYVVAPYQYLAWTGSGHTPSRSEPSYWEDCDIAWVTTGDVAPLRSERIEGLQTTKYHISRKGMANSAARLHSRGTVFLSRTASVGFSGVMFSDMATSQDFFTWTPGPKLRSAYLLYVLRAMKSRGLFDAMMFGSTHNTIYVPELMQLRGPLPSVDEQDRIVAAIREFRAGAFATIDVIEKAVELLRTRRRSLITAAVTGQIVI